MKMLAKVADTFRSELYILVRMNRLIIIGNGFDLAHGRKTSYKDFAAYLLRGCIERAYDDSPVSFDGALTVRPEKVDRNWSTWSDDELFRFARRESDRAFLFRDGFIRNVLSDVLTNNWVDIEYSYYYLLAHSIQVSPTGRVLPGSQVNDLNNEFQTIQNQLVGYLASKVQNVPFDEISQFVDILDRDSTKRNGEPKGQTLILNFNYTDTIRRYVRQLHSSTTVIDIHGQLDSDEPNIIFGYGDERDSFYSRIEDLNRNEFLRYIKSFKYLESRNYSDLMRFVDGGNYDVAIIGHSCGISDRVLLSNLFERDRCKSIKVFYYKDKNGFNQTCYDISRHFSDKQMLRTKLLDFSRSEPCPQFK